MDWHLSLRWRRDTAGGICSQTTTKTLHTDRCVKGRVKDKWQNKNCFFFAEKTANNVREHLTVNVESFKYRGVVVSSEAKMNEKEYGSIESVC